MNELLDLTGKVDPNSSSTLGLVNEVTSSLELPYLVVGATARDMVLHHGYGVRVQRATTDIDFAVQVESWDVFSALKDELVKKGFTCTNNQHRLFSPKNIPIDVVPFGGIENGNGDIAWPPNGDVVMSVRGFQEAIDDAQRVVIAHNPLVICPVVTPEGLMFLKLISWAERPADLRRKDANDIQYLLKNYHCIKNIREDIYNEDHLAEFERYGWDQELASCNLLGKACSAIVSSETYAEISKLRDLDATKNVDRIAEEMNDGITSDNLRMLEAFMDGFDRRS